MPLGTVDRSPPPFFKQGASALSKVLLLGALSVFLMVGDARFQWATPVRAALATVLHPVQWLAIQPLKLSREVNDWLLTAQDVDAKAKATEQAMLRQAQRAAMIEQLTLENIQLRQLLAMKAQLPTRAQGAEVRYESTHGGRDRVVINIGAMQAVKLGAPVIDGFGVLGQVTEVYPLSAEVTLITDDEHLTPILNTRTGLRSVAQGLGMDEQGAIAVRYIAKPDDMRVGDLLTTSGVDGVYPSGLPVAVVSATDDKTTEGGFFRVLATPSAHPKQALKVLVLDPHDTLAEDKERQP